MAIINRILCPVDFSDQSRHALDEAVALGRHFQAPITALYVLPPPVPPIAALESSAYTAYIYSPEELTFIGGHVRAFVDGQRGETAIEVRVEQGYVVSEIVDAAARLTADLIVIGTHGRGGFQRLFLGSVAERVLASAACPVMTVPPRMPEAVPCGPSLFAHVLCAIDYSESSLRALRLAAALSTESGARLTLVHVVETATSEPALAEGFSGTGHESLLVATARTQLHAHRPAAVSDARDVVLTGKPSRAILQLARDQGADLIVAGAHAGLASLLGLGSTTNRIVREATCPVISVRA
jgi:nucleotide-binding universal stress UspA family protein